MIKKGENSFIELGEKIAELIEMMAPITARCTIHIMNGAAEAIERKR